VQLGSCPKDPQILSGVEAGAANTSQVAGRPNEKMNTMNPANMEADLCVSLEQSMLRSLRRNDAESMRWQLNVWKKIVFAEA
jgi:hypothetical protein